MLPNQSEDFMALLKEGKIEEVRILLEAAKLNARYAPDTVNVVKGKAACFTKKGKPVVLGDDGKWRLKG